MGVGILQLGCTIMCPHGGQATAIPGNTQVQVGNGFALLETDTMIIAGCPFTVPPGTPMPCLTIQWTAPATSVTVNGTPVLLTTSVGLCLNALSAPQGTAIVAGAQTQASGE
jgi:hypothetical protein